MSEDNHLDSSVPDSTQLGFDGFPEGGSTRKRRITVRQKAVIPVTIRKNFPLINSMSSAVQTNVQQKLLNIVIKYVQTQERDAQGFWTSAPTTALTLPKLLSPCSKSSCTSTSKRKTSITRS